MQNDVVLAALIVSVPSLRRAVMEVLALNSPQLLSPFPFVVPGVDKLSQWRLRAREGGGRK